VEIFGIGLHKTGTTSLHKGVERLGYRSLHWGGPATSQAARRALNEGLPVLDYLPGFDAYTDIGPLMLNFHLLDQRYSEVGSSSPRATSRAGWRVAVATSNGTSNLRHRGGTAERSSRWTSTPGD
jgi:hypothetical protein